MKKIITSIVSVVMGLTLMLGVFASSPETIEVDKGATVRYPIEANSSYTFQLGISGDNTKIKKVTLPHFIDEQDMEKGNATADYPAYVTVIPKDIYINEGATNGTLVIDYRDTAGENQKLTIRLEAYPEMKTVYDWDTITNGVTYRAGRDEDKVTMDFYAGEIEISTKGQKDFNLSYLNTVTKEDIEFFGDSLVEIIDFKGQADFNYLATIKFHKTLYDEEVYVYKDMGDYLTEIELEQGDFLVEHITKLGKYIIVNEPLKPELEEGIVEPEASISDPLPKPIPEYETNINDNPTTGR